MKLKIGNPATGDDFFNRETLKNRILRSLERDHVAFVGPRRTGKTSLLKDIESNPPEGVLAVFLDLEEFDSVPAWISAMLARTKRLLSTPAHKSWLERSGKAAKGILSQIERIEILGNEIKLASGKPSSEVWRPMADQFLELLRESNLPIYFLLDEFPWYLGLVAKRHTPIEVESVLNWFRGITYRERFRHS
jgi:AAA+ ATPase superfamily predicted ATPase